MLKIYICDDDRAWLDRAEELIRDHFAEISEDAVVETCSSIDEISDAPDIVFMDIEFDSREQDGAGEGVSNGIEAAAKLNTMYPQCQIVYLTNYLSYALDVYGTEHVWYVLKDQLSQRLPDVTGRIMQSIEESRAELVVMGSGGRMESILCRDIMYLERKDRRTLIITSRGRYEVKDRIHVILGKMPSRLFARCHNSYAVNLSKVRGIQKGSLTLKDGTEILISRGYGRSFRTEYMNWAGERIVR